MQVFVLEQDIVVGRGLEEGDLGRLERARLLDGITHIKKACLESLARWHQTAGTDHHIIFDHGPVQQDGTHADQHPVAYGAAMQHRLVADRDILADQQWIAAGVAGTLAGQVQYCAVLNVAARTDADMVDVPSGGHHGPDAGIVTQLDIAHQGGAGVYIYPFAQLRAFSLVRSQSQVHLGLLVFGHSSNSVLVSVDKFV